LSNSQSRAPFASSLRRDSDWSAGEEEENPDGAENLDYELNEDEDEFGLPSIANARRAARRAGGPSLDLPSDSRVSHSDLAFLDGGAMGMRPRANSSDIAEERGVPSYNVPRKSEGKILRPQYKEILRGV
jgi:hypothetical protein